ncbi:hypothetical protein J1N35_041516 [Gossypium stocksii]|uniref:Uncharacterized protein n=1 Tax=Gossypium stocksii TaxID=47602 RepID=A0A9D3UHI5_9ROSI|nr:hypothetical protein J1N35_041516 [Gossypium stocksii]
MKEIETAEQYANRIMAVVNNIRLLEEEFKDNKVIENVIITLPERYESKISLLKGLRDLSIISLSESINFLYAQEQRKASRQWETQKKKHCQMFNVEVVNNLAIWKRPGSGDSLNVVLYQFSG